MKPVNKNLLYIFLALWLLVAAILSGLTEDVVNADPIVNFDKYWSAIFITWHSGLGTAIFSGITLLGNWQLVIPVIFLIVYFLYKKNKREYIIPLIFTVISAEAITFLGKILVHRSRPLGATITELDFSFPSGHATIAVAFYGYLAYLYLRNNKAKRAVTIFGALIIILLIGFSRLYLGVHYISDVLAGYLVGLLALIAGISLNEWLKSSQILKR